MSTKSGWLAAAAMALKMSPPHTHCLLLPFMNCQPIIPPPPAAATHCHLPPAVFKLQLLSCHQAAAAVRTKRSLSFKLLQPSAPRTVLVWGGNEVDATRPRVSSPLDLYVRRRVHP